MDRLDELATIRRAYAKQIMGVAERTDPRVEAAFATIRREDFLGPGPWQIMRWLGGYRTTPDPDPVHLYANVVVGIIPERGITNGEPSLHAKLISIAAPQAGQHVVHVGAGLGYYTAILAELVGATGKVTAIEFDADLAARAADNLRSRPNVVVVHGDATIADFDPVDLIYVSAGVTRPPDKWLDSLRDRGQLLVPLTTNNQPDLKDPTKFQRQGVLIGVEY